MVQRPVRRQYPERSRSGPGDVDLARRARFAHAFGWLAMAGLMWGGLIGLVVGGSVAAVLLGAFLGIVVLGGGGGLAILWATEGLGGMARVLYNPSGSTTPHRRDHSFAKSLVARGAYQEAVQAYVESLAEDPSDPEPYVAVARIFRDELKQYEEAAQWFRRARTDAELDRGQELLVARELVELYREKLGQPRKAAPELARLAESFAGTPDGDWAAAELRELKESMT